MRSEATKLKSTSKYPTSVIVRGVDPVGIELAEALIEQGGYVVMIDSHDEKSFEKLGNLLDKELFTFLDFSALVHLEDDLRRLDYVFFMNHQSVDIEEEISTQNFLELSNYLNSILDLATKFETKFLLTTSIKAHRLLLGEQDVHMNFDPDSKKKHTVYSEVEIHRYAESLVMEYIEKVSLNARIIRIGEVIGEGMEFHENTTIGRLIFAAITGENLEVYGDGLEEEYYVHYLDAVYGLLKGQFTTNTKGRIFSLANQEAITTLSLAYKIQELEPRAGEIKFIDKKTNNASLKLYKPAENLSEIGWKPKVGFERALSQSIEQAYNFFNLNSSTGKADSKDKKKDGGFSKKLKDFFFVSKKEEEGKIPAAGQENYGALARLIAERKNQEFGRDGSIVLANDKLRRKVKDKEGRPVVQKVNTKLNKFFDKVKSDLSFLGKLTFGEFLLYAFFILIGGILYFGLISPAVSIGKDVYLGYQNLKSSEDNFANEDLEEASKKASQAFKNFETAERTFSRFEEPFALISQSKLYENSFAILRGGKLYSEGLSSAFSAVAPIYGYFQSFSDKVYYRPNDTSLLTAQPEGDYSMYFAQMESKESVLEEGINKILSGSTAVSNADRAFLPNMIETEVSSFLQHVDPFTAKLESMKKMLTFMPELFGQESAKSYLILLHDNARYNPAGGKINSYALITFEFGNVKLIKSGNISDLSIGVSAIGDKTIEQINLSSFQSVTRQDVTFEDLQLIGDYGNLVQALTPLFEDELDSPVDGVISMNLESLEKLVALYGTVEVEQVSFNGNNLLSNIDLILQDSNSEKRREDVITQVFAQTLQKVITGSRTNFSDLFDTLELSLDGKNLLLDMEGSQYQQYVSENGWNGDFDNASDFIKVFPVTKSTEFEQNRYPTINVNIDIKINADLTSSKRVEITPKSLSDLDYVVVCIPAGSTDLDLNGINPLLFNQNFDSQNECMSIKFSQIEEAVITYKNPAFENVNNASYNYSSSLQNSPGVSLVYDYEIDYDDSLAPTEYDSKGLLQGGRLIYAGSIEGDLILDITFKK